LVHDPSIVLADEPTASLDTERAYQVIETLAKLIHEQDRAGVMVTHDLRMCVYADRVIQLVDGRLARTISDRGEIEALADPGKPGTRSIEGENVTTQASPGATHFSRKISHQ
jgi:putative ABC transport system ATP-binding protein